MFNDGSMLQAIRGPGQIPGSAGTPAPEDGLLGARFFPKALSLSTVAGTPAKMRVLMSCLIEKRALLT
ncbi:hypothetical protein ACSZNB_03385 [Aeromonas hydrophila]